MPRLALICALIPLLNAGRVATTPARPDLIYPHLGQPGLNVLHYDVSLQVPQPGTPPLRAAVVALLRAETALPSVQFDYAGPDIQEVRWNGVPAPYHRQTESAKLIIDRPLKSGETVRISVTSAGAATGHPDATLPIQVGWQSVPATPGQPGANFAFSEPDGTHAFMPCNDHPSDPATFTTHLTIPRGVTAVASGARTGDRANPDGTHTVTYDLATPIPTYALGVHIGTLEPSAHPPLDLNGRTVTRTDYFPTNLPATVRAPYDRTDDMLRALTHWFGPYPFSTLGSVVVTPALPALETAALLTMPVRSSRDRVLVHEIAHQWFGNAIPMGDWSDTWLNEGFATYAELLWAETEGQDTQALLDGWRDRLRPGTRPLPATTQAQLFDQTAYARGALALHALRTQVGDPPFRTFLQRYVSTRRGRPTRTADLLNLTREQLGTDAADLLNRWVTQDTLPDHP